MRRTPVRAAQGRSPAAKRFHLFSELAAPHVHELGEGVPFLALWWVRTGHIPSAQEGIAKLKLLGVEGPHAGVFTLKQAYTPQGVPLER